MKRLWGLRHLKMLFVLSTRAEIVIEKIAEAQHKIWAHWMKYLFSKAKVNQDGSVTISADLVERWSRQMHTSYKDLTDTEKESDRRQANKVLNSIGIALQ